MNPGPPRILTCPRCGKKKQVLTLASGNTAWQEVWSDNKRILPYLPYPSFVQRCPHCGEYFLLSRQHKEELGRGFCTKEGKLQFHQLKEAFEKLTSSIEFTDEERQDFLFNLVWAYNDRFNSTEESGRTSDPLKGEDEKYYDEDVMAPKVGHSEYGSEADEHDFDEEKQNKMMQEWEEQLEQERREALRKEIPSDANRRFFEKIMLELLDSIKDSLLRAEFLREIGHFEDAVKELEDANPSDEFLVKVKEKIEGLITQKDTKVFSLTHLYNNYADVSEA